MSGANPFDAYVHYQIQQSGDIPMADPTIEAPTPFSAWTEHTTGMGKKYYSNSQTNTTQWTKPVDLMTPQEVELDALPWDELVSEGRKYYYNKETKETTWVVPDAWTEIAERWKGIEDRKQAASVPLSSVPLARPVINPHFNNFDAGIVNFDTMEERESAFIGILKELEITADTTWDDVLHLIISHPNYRCLRSLAQRKLAFATFMESKRRVGTDEIKRRFEKNRLEFVKVLERRREVSFESSWRDVAGSFKHEAVFRRMTAHESQRVFHEYVGGLNTAHDEAERRGRAMNKERIGKVIHKLHERGDIRANTRWIDASQMIKSSRELRDERYLDMADMLGQYEDFIKGLDIREGKEGFDGRARTRRHARGNRDAFKRLLRDLVKDGKIYCLTKWMDIYPIVKREDCYVNMLGQEGSSPLDLFFDLVIEGDETYRRDKAGIKAAIKDAGFGFSNRTTRKEFMAVLGDKLRRLEGHSADIVFDELMLDAEYFHEQDSRRREKKERREREDLKDDFKYLLKHLDPPLGAESWEDVGERVKGCKEYKVLSEDARKDVWERVRMRLVEKKASDEKKEAKRAREAEGGGGSDSSPRKKKKKSKHHDDRESPKRGSPKRDSPKRDSPKRKRGERKAVVQMDSDSEEGMIKE